MGALIQLRGGEHLMQGEGNVKEGLGSRGFMEAEGKTETNKRGTVTYKIMKLPISLIGKK
jgi:hypothetical protein